MKIYCNKSLLKDVNNEILNKMQLCEQKYFYDIMEVRRTIIHARKQCVMKDKNYAFIGYGSVNKIMATLKNVNSYIPQMYTKVHQRLDKFIHAIEDIDNNDDAKITIVHHPKYEDETHTNNEHVLYLKDTHFLNVWNTVNVFVSKGIHKATLQY